MNRYNIWSIIFLMVFFSFTSQKKNGGKMELVGKNWAEKLGYPSGSKVVILHADDVGMCPEANEAAKAQLTGGYIQSASAMVPCSSFTEFANWSIQNPTYDVGLHLTLTSEWKTHRWGPILSSMDVPGLMDKNGYFWKTVYDVVKNATAQEVEKEIRAQIEKAISIGMVPDHIDTHMGALYGSPEFAKVFFKVAMEYNIPANVIQFTPEIIKKFGSEGYPISDEMIALVSQYSLPKLDDFFSVPKGETYDEKVAKFLQLIQSLKPGISEIIFHPSIESSDLKNITKLWQQRVWEAEMFSDPFVIQFMQSENILFTNWNEIMTRFEKRTGK